MAKCCCWKSAGIANNGEIARPGSLLWTGARPIGCVLLFLWHDDEGHARVEILSASTATARAAVGRAAAAIAPAPSACRSHRGFFLFALFLATARLNRRRIHHAFSQRIEPFVRVAFL